MFGSFFNETVEISDDLRTSRWTVKLHSLQVFIASVINYNLNYFTYLLLWIIVLLNFPCRLITEGFVCLLISRDFSSFMPQHVKFISLCLFYACIHYYYYTIWMHLLVLATSHKSFPLRQAFINTQFMWIRWWDLD